MTAPLHLLVVEDNVALVANLFDYFEARGHSLDAAPDGVTGLHLATHHVYDAIVLDWNLPRLDGHRLLSALRHEHHNPVPVVMLTARDELEDKLACYQQGADDYLAKPFAIPELEARLLAVLARTRGRGDRSLQVADLVYDLASLEVRRDGQLITLYPACRKLLEALLRASPDVVSHEQLERAVWGDAPPDADLLRSHVHVLRRAIDKPFAKKLIHTVSRSGYRLADLSEG